MTESNENTSHEPHTYHVDARSPSRKFLTADNPPKDSAVRENVEEEEGILGGLYILRNLYTW